MKNNLRYILLFILSGHLVDVRLLSTLLRRPLPGQVDLVHPQQAIMHGPRLKGKEKDPPFPTKNRGKPLSVSSPIVSFKSLESPRFKTTMESQKSAFFIPSNAVFILFPSLNSSEVKEGS